jgi:HEAT repeat protein
MIADYMENGFLDNIIDMFRHDRTLYSLVGELIRDERVRVRVGVTALVEEMKRLDPGNVSLALENLHPLLDHPDAVVRGDSANLVGIIGERNSQPYLRKLLADRDGNVRSIAAEALAEMGSEPG